MYYSIFKSGFFNFAIINAEYSYKKTYYLNGDY